MVLLESHSDIVLEVAIRVGVLGHRLEVDDEVVLDGKDGVDTEMGIVAGVDLVDDGGVVRVGDLQVDVRGPHGRAVHKVEQHPCGPVGGQRVRRWVVAVPPEIAVLVRKELAAEVVVALVGVLEVVLAVGGGLPDVKEGADNGLASLQVTQLAVHEGDLAVRVGVLDDGIPEFAEGGVGGPERTQDDVGSGRVAVIQHDLVGDLVDQSFQTDHVTDAMAFVADGSTDLTDGVDELHAQHPFRGGQLDLASKLMDVLDQSSQDNAGPLRDLGSHGVDDIGRELGVKSTLGVGGHGG